MRSAAFTLLLLATPWLAFADDKDNDKEKDKKDAEVEFNEKLQQELLDLLKDDQEIRKDLLKDPKNPDLEMVKKMQAQARKNTARLKQIVAQYGWPSPKLIGEEGVSAMYALLQHADSDRAFQRRCLKLMQEAVKKGHLQKQYVAAMTDYLLVIEKKKQRYGTQFTINAKGELVPHAIADEANVDKRREEMGLPKLEDHLKMLRAQYKKP